MEAVRIVDVNLNRAREALRVIEDYARFCLDDAAAAEAVKLERHRVRTIADVFGDALLDARDIAGDVGREIKTEGEGLRHSEEGVVRAAFGRLSEAARSIAEYAKMLTASDGAASQAVAAAEQLRYRAYELEQTVALRGALRRRFRECSLYVIVTESLCRRPWLETIEAAIEGGAGCIQLREKGLGDAELLSRARKVRDLTRDRSVLFILNDRADVARLARADGVHLGQSDLPVRDARKIGGGRLLVGKSTHSCEEIEAAMTEEPDYIAVGPVFESATKAGPPPVGVGLVTWAAERADMAVVGIGGINQANAAPVIAAGAHVVCTCSAVAGADDPRQAAERFSL